MPDASGHCKRPALALARVGRTRFAWLVMRREVRTPMARGSSQAVDQAPEYDACQCWGGPPAPARRAKTGAFPPPSRLFRGRTRPRLESTTGVVRPCAAGHRSRPMRLSDHALRRRSSTRPCQQEPALSLEQRCSPIGRLSPALRPPTNSAFPPPERARLEFQREARKG
jgi:hypothetical protein